MNNLVKFGIIMGFTSVILVMLLGQSRVFYSMSRDGLVPGIFSDIHPTFKTPWRSNLLFFVFVAPFSTFLPLSIVGHMTSIGTLFAFVIVCAGVWVMGVKNPDAARPFKTPLVPFVPIMGILWNLAMMYALARMVQLAPAVHLAGDRAGDLLHLQPPSQPIAEAPTSGGAETLADPSHTARQSKNPRVPRRWLRSIVSSRDVGTSF
jgi:amino acid transporter